jgi:Protein of unknown function (DUF2975)
MNANEIRPQANVRLKRIRIISRVLKILFTLYLICFGPYLLFVDKMPDGYRVVEGTYAAFSDVPLIAKFVVGVAAVLILAGVISCHQLLNLFGKGIIFSARNVRLLGRIGFLALSYKLLGIIGPLLIQAWNGWIGAFTFHPIVIWLDICQFMISPLVIGGFFLIVISRIMDEGRKIQEEQELTV